MFRYIYISSPSPGWRRQFKYKGDLDKDGLPHGKGEGICNRGHNYNGQWSHGKMHGLGIYYYPSGTFYMGQFENDRFNGDGVYVSARKKSKKNAKYKCSGYPICVEYSGQWVNDKRHGKGTSILANGSTYTGFWYNDRRLGQGRFRETNGNWIEGQWNQNRINGWANKWDSKSKILYNGFCKNGKKHGEHTLSKKNPPTKKCPLTEKIASEYYYNGKKVFCDNICAICQESIKPFVLKVNQEVLDFCATSSMDLWQTQLFTQMPIVPMVNYGVSITSCGHVYHTDCIHKWIMSAPTLKQKSQCPTCKNEHYDVYTQSA